MTARCVVHFNRKRAEKKERERRTLDIHVTNRIYHARAFMSVFGFFLILVVGLALFNLVFSFFCVWRCDASFLNDVRL